MVYTSISYLREPTVESSTQPIKSFLQRSTYSLHIYMATSRQLSYLFLLMLLFHHQLAQLHLLMAHQRQVCHFLRLPKARHHHHHHHLLLRVCHFQPQQPLLWILLYHFLLLVQQILEIKWNDVKRGSKEYYSAYDIAFSMRIYIFY